MKKITLILLAIVSTVFYGCDNENDDQTIINLVSFETTSYEFGVDIQSSSSNDIKVYTTTILSSDRTFNISVLADLSTADPASYVLPATVTVPANTNVGAFNVNISDLNISPEGETLTIAFTGEDELFIGDPITLNIKQICPLPETVLAITFDGFPEEQSWELYDANDVLLFEGGPYPDETEFVRAFCLSAGTYKIVMLDAFGDGGGPYTITNNGTELVSSDGVFGFGEEQIFQIN